MVQLEEPLSILPMQGFWNKIYYNVHDIIGWDPNEVKNNVERIIVVEADASDISTGRGIISEGEVEMVQGTYSPYPIRI